MGKYIFLETTRILYCHYGMQKNELHNQDGLNIYIYIIIYLYNIYIYITLLYIDIMGIES